jgi:hypothetical protein
MFMPILFGVSALILVKSSTAQPLRAAALYVSDTQRALDALVEKHGE